MAAGGHTVLGAGGVGLLVGAALARTGRDVVLLVRPQALEAYDGTVHVESAVLGDFSVPVRAAARLDEDADVLWVATKATALEEALPLAPAGRVGLVVPLLNGVEHVERLRRTYTDVVAASIAVESERIAPGRVRQTSPFARVTLAPDGAGLAAGLRETGLEVVAAESEAAVLWGKLAFLAPLALATAAANGPFGAVRADARLRSLHDRCRAEVCAVAAAEGAPQDLARLAAVVEAAGDGMRTSMQKDVAAGRAPELDAIGGAVIRAARRHGIAVPATEELVGAVEARLA